MSGAKGGAGGVGSSGREGGRSLKVRVKTGARRSMSSKLWLERQLNDPYVAAAKREGWRSRAVYKFIELDERFNLLKPGHKIVDLGAAPGGFFVAKVFQGGAEGELLTTLKRDFTTVRHVKPKASRADSAELYVLATGYRRSRPEKAESE